MIRGQRPRFRRGAAAVLVGLAFLAPACADSGTTAAPDDARRGASARGNGLAASYANSYEVGWTRAIRLASAYGFMRHRKDARSVLAHAVRTFQLNFAADRRFIVCPHLTDAGQHELAEGAGRHDGDYFQGCKDTIATANRERRKRGEKTVVSAIRSVKIDGDHATVQIQDPGGDSRPVPFVRTGARSWAVTSFSYIYPDVVLAKPPGPGYDNGDPHRMSAEQAIEEAVYDIQAWFPRGLGREVCSALTRSGRREIEVADKRGAACPAAVAELAKRTAATGFQPRFSKVVSVDRSGRRATAMLHDRGDTGKPQYPVSLEFEGGHWRLSSLTLVEPLDLDAPRQGRSTLRDLDDPSGLDARGLIREAFTDLQADFGVGMTTTVCSDLSRDGQRELVALAREDGDRCQNVVHDIATWNRAHRISPRYSQILRIRVLGSKGYILVKDPLKPPYEVPFVREARGGWQLVSLARAESIAAALVHLRRLRAIRTGGG